MEGKEGTKFLVNDLHVIFFNIQVVQTHSSELNLLIHISVSVKFWPASYCCDANYALVAIVALADTKGGSTWTTSGAKRERYVESYIFML